MIEVREVLRVWLSGDDGLRRVAELSGVDRKTARRYVAAAEELGVVRGGGLGQLTDELLGQVVDRVRPARPAGHGQSWAVLDGEVERITTWVGQELSLVKMHDLLSRSGVVVPYRTLHRFAVDRAGYAGRGQGRTVRVADGEPGVECQVDFGRLGLIDDPETGRRRVAHALIFTAVYSRHMFVWVTVAQTLPAVIAGCEAAWAFFGGVFRVLIPDNLSPVVTDADAVNPVFTTGWLDYAQARGFVTDPARVRHAQDKPRVERTVHYVQNNFFAGETFVDLADAQARAEKWCRETAGQRIHGTIQARPAEVFAAEEAPALLPAPDGRYDVPVFARPKVHRDHHISVGKALYSIPGDLIGQRVQVRADQSLVKVFAHGQLVKTHPRVAAGRRQTDPADLPAEKSDYALRDVHELARKAATAGPAVGIYAQRMLDVDLPWTRMRQVHRLLGLVKSYGPETVNTACASTLELDVVDVSTVKRMLEQAREHQPAPQAGPLPGQTGRFARDPAEFATRTPAQVAR